MKTLKEVTLELNEEIKNNKSYIYWYKDALEWVLNDVINAGEFSVETIEKYLQDLINK